MRGERKRGGKKNRVEEDENWGGKKNVYER